MPDFFESIQTSASSVTSNFPMPPSTPFMAKKRKNYFPIFVYLLAIVTVSSGTYFIISGNLSPATVVEIRSSAEPNNVNILDAIPKLTKSITWSTPITSTIPDKQGSEIRGLLITTPQIDFLDPKMSLLFGEKSPLILDWGWTKLTNESDSNQSLTVYQKNHQKLYIRYQYAAYYVLLAQ